MQYSFFFHLFIFLFFYLSIFSFPCSTNLNVRAFHENPDRIHTELKPPAFNWWISLLYVLLSPYFCFISFSYLDLYVLGDDASTSLESFMRTKHLRVLIHIRIIIKGEVGAVKHV